MRRRGGRQRWWTVCMAADAMVAGGCGGAYVFPGSDLIVASDMEGGLFVLRWAPR